MASRNQQLKELIHQTVVGIISWFVNNKDDESYYITERLTKLAQWVESHPSSGVWTKIDTPDDLPEEGKVVLGVMLTSDSNNKIIHKKILCQWKPSDFTEYGQWYSPDGEPLKQMSAWMHIPEYDPMPDYIDERYHRPEPW